MSAQSGKQCCDCCIVLIKFGVSVCDVGSIASEESVRITPSLRSKKGFCHFLVHSKAIACGADLCFTSDVFFLHSRNLRDAWADRHEILHDGQK